MGLKITNKMKSVKIKGSVLSEAYKKIRDSEARIFGEAVDRLIFGIYNIPIDLNKTASYTCPANIKL